MWKGCVKLYKKLHFEQARLLMNVEVQGTGTPVNSLKLDKKCHKIIILRTYIFYENNYVKYL